MPELSRFFGIIIAMYFSEHNPPHFHALYGEKEVEIDLRTLGVVAGNIPPRALGLVMEWAASHRDALLEDWELARAKRPLKTIPPLE
jgi:hypothetical protein